MQDVSPQPDVDERDVAFGVAVCKRLDDLDDVRTAVDRGICANPQHTGEANRGFTHVIQSPLELLVSRSDAVTHLRAKRGEPHSTAGALKQAAANTGLERTDGLADSSMGDVESLG